MIELFRSTKCSANTALKSIFIALFIGCAYSATLHARTPLAEFHVSTVVADSTTPAPAQEMQDVIYLNSGSVFSGTLIEQSPTSRYVLQLADGTKLDFMPSEIRKITREPKLSDKDMKKLESERYSNRRLDGVDDSKRIDPNSRIDFWDDSKLKKLSMYYLGGIDAGLVITYFSTKSVEYGFKPTFRASGGTRFYKTAFIGVEVGYATWSPQVIQSVSSYKAPGSTQEISVSLQGIAASENFFIDGSFGPMWQSYSQDVSVYDSTQFRYVTKSQDVTNVAYKLTGGVHYPIRGTSIALQVQGGFVYVSDTGNFYQTVAGGISFSNLFSYARGIDIF